MNILICSRFFPPSIGGLGRLMETLAEEFVRQGHSVEVITEVGGEGTFPFPVHRAPRFREFLQAARRSDVIMAAPLSLRAFVPQLLSRRPIAVAHPDITEGHGLGKLPALIKRTLYHFLTNISPSRYLADNFPHPVVILNTYDTRLFHWPREECERSNMIFVGRLEQWKGCRTLVEAFAALAHERPELRLTIVGDGPELPVLRRLAQALGVDGQVDFAGILLGDELAEAMARHKVLVVPTIGQEPFGIVALEGLASGCRLVVSRSGGLPEAVGSCALMFTPGDAEELTSRLRQALEEAETPERRAAVEAHLRQFEPSVVANQYLEVFRKMTR
jgi:glycosyltransferase involved in cell wall biosynthesis